MAKLRIANWNIEWMNRWFTDDKDGPHADAYLQPSHEITGVTDIHNLAERVAQVINNLDADILTIQEGPSRRQEMEFYVERFLGNRFTVHGPAGKGQQKIYALVRKSCPLIIDVENMNSSGYRKANEKNQDFDFEAPWQVDINANQRLESYSFTRPPLALKVTTLTERELFLISLHTKSKFVQNGEALWNSRETRQQFIEEALLSRRRIAAEAYRVRQYIDLLFLENPKLDLIVTGDLNDGPGYDFFKQPYLTHNIAGIIAGNAFSPRTMLRHAFIDLMPENLNFTAKFYDYIDKIHRSVLLDHIFVSPNLFWKGQDRSASGNIEHDIFNEQIDLSLEGSREKQPSDHRPQTAIIEI